MRQRIFAIFDEKAKAFLPPFFLPEVAMAVRTFGDCVNDPAHAFGRHPADYTLFSFGVFDQLHGKFEVAPAMELVANGVMLKVGHSLSVDQQELPLSIGNGLEART